MNVSYRRPAFAAAERERRAQALASAPRIAERFPNAGRFAIAMAFQDPNAASQPSPMRHIFEPSMQAHFEVRCPLRDCAGGGFDLTPSIATMLSRRGEPRTGRMSCGGSRGRDNCNLELTYTLTLLDG